MRIQSSQCFDFIISYFLRMLQTALLKRNLKIQVPENMLIDLPLMRQNYHASAENFSLGVSS